MGHIVKGMPPSIRNTNAGFAAQNAVILASQSTYETDTGLYKLGDGIKTYNQLAWTEPPYEFSPATGTNTYVATYYMWTILGYFDGLRLRIKFANTNTGASTINLNSLGAISLVKGVATPLVAGDILAGGIYDITYDGTNFQINLSASTSIGSVAWLLAGNALTGGTAATPNEFIGSTNTYDWIIRTNNVERARMASGGAFLGINDTAPANRLNINSPGTADASAQVLIYTGAAANEALVIQGFAGQTANLLLGQTSAGAISSRLSVSGQLSLNSANFTTVSPLNILGSATLRDGLHSAIEIQPDAGVADLPAIVFGNQTSNTRVGSILWTRSSSGSDTSVRQVYIRGYESGTAGRFEILLNSLITVGLPTTVFFIAATNTGIGGAVTFGTSVTRSIAMTNGTAPSADVANQFALYCNDIVAGNAAPHFRTENGNVVKLFRGAAVADATGAGDVVAQLNALLAIMRVTGGNGLIAD